MPRVLALATLAAACCGLALLAAPSDSRAFVLTGESLDLDQRAFRVLDAFALADENLVPQPSFPGQAGAPLAIWKAHVE